ncbi:MAG TPA: TIGR03118 family protein [Candidatus Sulfotelmatobacter sp.]|nr:TIGR03118 family protein [Candidatus Sulfotelmatobacter sp.]
MAGVFKSGAARFAAIVGCACLLLTPAFAQHYTRTDLTTNSSSVSAAPNVDPNLVNAWGLSRATASPWWISDNGTGVSTLYDGTGAPRPLVVTIPPPLNQQGTAAPTGTVHNYTTSFELAPGVPAVFLFATEDGTISGWNPAVNPTAAVVKVNRPKHAIYKGLAVATTDDGPRLYASNFKMGTVEVYDGNFHRRHAEERFRDSSLPPHFVPFGIQNVGGNIVVTFAHRNPGSKDEDHGPGLGYVRVFDTEGHLLLRLQHGTFLNAPWGIAMAPGDFGPFSHRLLIGNFGDGTIAAFNALSGRFEGNMLDSSGAALAIDGLWALSFAGSDAINGSPTDLYFTAGPNDENDGIFGKLTATDSEQRGNAE